MNNNLNRHALLAEPAAPPSVSYADHPPQNHPQNSFGILRGPTWGRDTPSTAIAVPLPIGEELGYGVRFTAPMGRN